MSKPNAAAPQNAELVRSQPTGVADALPQYLRAVRGFFIKRVRPGEVDDMVQTVALRIQTRSNGGEIDNPERYIFQVARSVMIDQHRKNVTRFATQHETLEEWHHPVEEISPDRIVEGADTLRQVMEALQLLPDRARQAFVLHRFENLSYAEIAEEMGISMSGVEKHIMKAIGRLSVVLADD